MHEHMFLGRRYILMMIVAARKGEKPRVLKEEFCQPCDGAVKS